MFRRSPRSLRSMLLWTAAAVVAVVTATVVGGDLAAIHRKARALGPPATVVVARHDLPVGSTVRAADLTTRVVHDGREPGVVASPTAATGRTVTVPILAGETVRGRHLAPARRPGLAGAVPDGKRAVRLTITNGLPVHRGDRVDVVATFDPAAGGDDTTFVVARAALVVASHVESERLGVTLLVDAADVESLASAQANGVLSLALTPPEAASGGADPPA